MQTKRREKTIVVVDGMGGGIGVQLVGKLREATGDNVEIIALGTNAVAVERMVKAGAHRGAAGENAICHSVRLGDFIVGPIGIIIGNSMMGEITCSMTEAILGAPGDRILLPLQNEHLTLAGLESLPLAKMIERAVELVTERIAGPPCAAPGDTVQASSRLA
ncbi:MAG: DUF3842 family protein [Spirochaetaceae bacterium]|jgi:hypothetical protein|nr:DUF3842 family protein [Spirochaetaceae bacterium]